jgi:hypothetical protein
VATGQSVTTAEDTAKAVTLVATDADVTDELAWTITTAPLHGVLSGVAPNLTYTPAANCHGADSFKFKVNDGHYDSNVVTVTIGVTSVNDAPVANAQSVVTTVNVSKAIALTSSDADGDARTYTVLTQPEHGTLTGTGASRTYKPTNNYTGPDSFTFKANDGPADSNVAVVTITVNPVNHAPAATAQSLTTAKDTTKAVTLGGTDADGDGLTYTVVTAPLHGRLTGTVPDLTYTPAAGYTGADSFTFKAYDGKAYSLAAKIAIAVGP